MSDFKQEVLKFEEGKKFLCVKSSDWFAEGDVLTVERSLHGRIVFKETGDTVFGSYALCEYLVNYKEKRPHYDLIIAWANGAEIQVKEIGSGRWLDRENPQFAEHLKYRIKPTESEKDLKIGELQKKAKEIQEELEKLKGED